MAVHVGVRLVLAIILSIIGWWYGKSGSSLSFAAGLIDGRYYPALYGILGALIGFLAAPLLVSLPFRAIRRVQVLPVRGLVMVVLGIIPADHRGIAGAGARPAITAVGRLLPIAILLLGGLGIVIASVHGAEICSLSAGAWPTTSAWAGASAAARHQRHHRWSHRRYRQDRLVRGTMLVPRFVLDELQYIADSPDALPQPRASRPSRSSGA